MRFIPLFIALLVISLPLNASISLAAITNIKAYGKDGIEGYLSSQDDESLVIEVSGTGSVTESQVRLWGYDALSGIGFTRCEFKGDNFLCILNYEEVSRLDNEELLNINLYDSNGNKIDSETTTIVKDILAPKVYKFKIIPEKTDDGMVLNIEYRVRDFAYDYNQDRCSGLTKIELVELVSSNVIKDQEVESCLAEGSFEVELDIAQEEKEHELLLRAYDAVGNMGSKKATVFVDSLPPQFLEGSLTITHAAKELKYFSTKIKAKVSLDIKSTDLKEVVADLSELNPNKDYENLKASCSVKDSGEKIYNCIWDIEVDIKNSGTFNLKFSASDNMGNTNEIELHWEIKIDNEGPMIESIKTNFEHDGKFYISEKTNFTVILTDDAGVEDIFLDLTPLREGILRAEECKLKDNKWYCYWYNKGNNLENGEHAKITVTGKDVLGNELIEKELEVIADKSKPTIKAIELPDKIIDEEEIKIILKVEDLAEGFVKVKADFSELGSDEEEVECKFDNSFWVCELTTMVNVLESKTAKLKFKVIDIVGHEYYEEKEVSVYIKETEDNPNLYKIVFDTDLILPIYKQVLKSTPTSFYYTLPFTLKPREDNCEIGDIQIICPDIMPEIYYIKSGQDYNGFIQFLVDRSIADSDLEALELSNCKLVLSQRSCGDIVYTKPELEFINLRIPILDTRTAQEELVKEIEKIKEDVSSNFYTITDSLSSIINLAAQLCQIIKSIYSGILAALDIANMVLQLFKANNPVQEARRSLGKKFESISPWINRVCINVECSSATAYLPKIGLEQKGKGTGGGKGEEKVPTAFKESPCEWLRNKIVNSSGEGKWGNITRDVWYPDTIELAKKSLLFSTLCFCLPGIVYNIKKWRELQCSKGICYRDAIALGYPKSLCDEDYRLKRCMYSWGEAQVWVDLILTPFRKIGSLSHNLLPSIWVAVRGYAMKGCGMGWPLSCPLQTVMIITENIADVTQINKVTIWEQPIEACTTFLKEEEDVNSE